MLCTFANNQIHRIWERTFSEDKFQAYVDAENKVEPKDWMPENTAEPLFAKSLNTLIAKLLGCSLRRIG